MTSICAEVQKMADNPNVKSAVKLMRNCIENLGQQYILLRGERLQDSSSNMELHPNGTLTYILSKTGNVQFVKRLKKSYKLIIVI
jgi:hypothetical protein